MSAMTDWMFGPDSEMWHVHREIAVLAGAQRALLMQVAHPLVAAAVDEHSAFPADAVTRLGRTLDAAFGVAFGTVAEATAAAEAVNAVHTRIHGTLREAAGGYEAGTRYDAADPALLAWVHATLADTAMVSYETFVGRLDRPRYYEESRRAASLFGVPSDALPGTVEEFDDYVSETVGSLKVSAASRRLAHDILRPPILRIRLPLPPLDIVTGGLLPAPLREPFGVRWGGRQERAFRAGAASTRAAVRLTPSLLRHIPAARRAARQAR
jgi:uncharacterized protein (DUF2236 family)